MVFWCLTRYYIEWDCFDHHAYSLHFRTKEEGLEMFNDYMNTEIDTYELKPDEYRYVEQGDHFEFEIALDFKFSYMVLEKVDLDRRMR